jgi:hypothetical protein
VLTTLAYLTACFVVVALHHWSQVSEADPRRLLAAQIEASFRSRLQLIKQQGAYR